MAANDEHIYEALVRIEKKQDDVLERVTRVETQLQPDPGQPGVIKQLQDDVKSLRESRSWMLGVIAALEFGGHWFAHKLGMK